MKTVPLRKHLRNFDLCLDGPIDDLRQRLMQQIELHIGTLAKDGMDDEDGVTELGCNNAIYNNTGFIDLETSYQSRDQPPMNYTPTIVRNITFANNRAIGSGVGASFVCSVYDVCENIIVVNNTVNSDDNPWHCHFIDTFVVEGNSPPGLEECMANSMNRSSSVLTTRIGDSLGKDTLRAWAHNTYSLNSSFGVYREWRRDMSFFKEESPLDMLQRRYQIWKSYIEKYGVYALDPYSDRTESEKALLLIQPQHPFNSIVPYPFRRFSPNFVARALRSGIDWREKGAVTPIKSQGVHGVCGTFGQTQAAESQYHLGGGGRNPNKKTHPLTQFSEQQLLSCKDGHSEAFIFLGKPLYLVLKTVFLIHSIKVIGQISHPLHVHSILLKSCQSQYFQM